MKPRRSFGPVVALVALAAFACGDADSAPPAADTTRAESPVPTDASAPGTDASVTTTDSQRYPGPGTGTGSLPDPAGFTRVLQEIVVDGRVDYEALEARMGTLHAYLEGLARTSPGALEVASHEERLAFWLNAYNACMLRLVVENRPLDEAGGWWSRLKNRVARRPANSVWQIPDVFTRQHCPVAGEARSQDGIEHGIIRPMGDPRIHFAVNCAAVSCPALAAEAYAAEQLDAQLERQVARFMEDPHHYRLEVEDGRPILRLNRVLEWFGEDFEASGGVAEFFAVRADPAERSLLRDPELEVRFMEYDWSLNGVGA